MPKDAAEPDAHPPPLRRGDACLYCRRRRIRCNAAKPTCQNCMLKRECVYDSGKPVSRVRQLEDRVAELEGYLRAGAAMPGVPAASATSSAVPVTGAPQAQPQPPPSTVPLSTGSDLMDWDTLDPSFMSLVNQLADTSTTQTSVHTPLPPQQTEALRQHLGHIPPEVDRVVQRVPVPAPAPVPGQGGADGSITSRTPLSLNPPTDLPRPDAFRKDTLPGLETPPPRLQIGYDIPIGGWWDPNDLPPAVREHLLNRFFGGLKLFNIFHVPRFMASLTLPPSKRPHPCLLYAIYLFVSYKSTDPGLKSLESHFLNIAITRLNESVSSLDRLFDAVRAAMILAVYRFQKTQYQAGVMMTAQAAQLSYTLGLHQIRSSVWSPPREGVVCGLAQPTMRQRRWMIDPPKDAVEHGERINAFWALYCVDRTSAVASQWPGIISDNEIITPFPRPLYEYETGMVSPQDDYSLSSMWDDSRPPQALPHFVLASHHILFLRALSLMDRASKLMYLPDEKVDLPVEPCDYEHCYTSIFFDIDKFLEESNRVLATNAPPPTSAAFAASRTPRTRTPNAYEKVRHGLLSIEADMLPHRRTNWGEANDPTPAWWKFEIWTPEVAGLIFMLGISWMFLFDVYAPYAENTKAVNVARQLVRCVHAKPASEYTGKEEDLIVTVCLSFVSSVLVRELRRLHGIGEHAQAGIIKQDLDVVVDALRMLGLPMGEPGSGTSSGPSGMSPSSGPGSESARPGPSSGPSGSSGPDGHGASANKPESEPASAQPDPTPDPTLEQIAHTFTEWNEFEMFTNHQNL